MKTLRIVYDHQVFSFQEYGGISRYYSELASRIAGYEGCTVAIHAPFYVNRYIRSKDDLKVVGIRIPVIPRAGNVISKLNNTFGGLMTRRCRPDVIHETYYSKYGTTPMKAKRIITVYDMIHEIFKDVLSPLDETSQYKLRAVKRADHVICISENTRRDLLSLIDVDPGKVSVIHLGYTIENQPLQSVSNVGNKPYILYVGQRGTYKNFERLLRAYSSSSKLASDFRLICFGMNSFFRTEVDLIKSLNMRMEDVVCMSGNDDVLGWLYSNAAAFVFPSLYEGFGVPLLEAMSFKCPVVCSNTSSLPEVAGEAAEYFDPYDVEAMRHSIESVVYSSERRDHLIEKGLERIGKFSWDRCAEETLRIYSSLV